MSRSLLVAGLLLAPAALAQVPQKLGYQGRLLKADGAPETGIVKFTFALFGAESGGTALWTEEQPIPLSAGFYATFLGESKPLPSGVFDGSERWLEVSVNGSAMTPRQRIGSVAYALMAETARNVAGGKVDADSLHVGGKPLVDSTGKLAADRLSLAVSKPIEGTGQTGTPLSLAKAGASSDGYLSAADWNTFKAGIDKAGGGVPSGAVMFFNLSACPAGWTELAEAQGRYLVGVPPGGTLGAKVGSALGDRENRPVGQHGHTVTDPEHSHGFSLTVDSREGGQGSSILDGATKDVWTCCPVGFSTAASKTGVSVGNAGSVAGTNAPFVQLRACQKD